MPNDFKPAIVVCGAMIITLVAVIGAAIAYPKVLEEPPVVTVEGCHAVAPLMPEIFLGRRSGASQADAEALVQEGLGADAMPALDFMVGFAYEVRAPVGNDTLDDFSAGRTQTVALHACLREAERRSQEAP